MPPDATARRRWLGGLALFGALAMLLAGETFLKNRISPAGFLLYWLVCLLLTGVAIVIAVLDAQALKQRTRQQHRELLDEALKQIETEARSRPPRPKSGRPGERKP